MSIADTYEAYREDRTYWLPKVEYRKRREQLYSELYSELFEQIYPSTHTLLANYLISKRLTAYAKALVIRKFAIKLSDVIDIAKKDWNEIKKILKERLEKQGFLRADVMADALIEEARARASSLVRKYLEKEAPTLVEIVAKYIIAFALAEKPIEEEKVYEALLENNYLT